MNRQTIIICYSLLISSLSVMSQQLPKIISQPKTNYLPDFSFAGYHFGESKIPELEGKIVDAVEFGVKANDGLDDSKDHYSTAYDMAILTKYAMMNPTYGKISGTKVHRAANPNEKWDRVWRNKNRLLTEKYKFTTGGKTGYTKMAKRTLVTTATKGDLNLIAVTLNASDDWNDHIWMYETAFKNYDLTEIISPGTIKSIKNKFYKKKVYVKSAVEYPLTANEESEIRVQYKMIKPKAGWGNQQNIPNVVGQAIVYLGDKEINHIPIYYRNKQEKKESFWDQFKSVLQLITGVNSNG